MSNLITPIIEENLPLVAIVGRPNTGKSTLFNRLIGKKRAITDPTAGVTRDAVVEKWRLYNRRIRLSDSGGITDSKEGFDDIVSRKSLSLFEDADVIVFLVDCKEVTSEDQFLVEKLRPYSDKVILAVNKVDDHTKEDLVWGYYEMGYTNVVALSAAHGYGIGELEQSIALMLDIEDNDDEIEERPVINLGVMGKPNTGKSTLVNALTQSDISIVSNIAGTTRDVVTANFEYRGQEYRILDTAGIRRKGKVGDDLEYYSVNRAIKTIDESDVILLMIDSIEGLSDQDKKIAQLIVRKGKGVIIVLNKIDLIPQIENSLVAMEDRIRFLFPILNFAPICAISAKEKIDIEELLDKVYIVNTQLKRRISTNKINEKLKLWLEAQNIPRGKGSIYYKIFYATQVSIEPVRFLFFVNRIKGFSDNYQQYLINCIRRDLGFNNIPINISLRERERNEYKRHDRSKSIIEAKENAERDGNSIDKKPKIKMSTPNTGGKAKAKKSPHKINSARNKKWKKR